jgi:hypothetical protein
MSSISNTMMCRKCKIQCRFNIAKHYLNDSAYNAQCHTCKNSWVSCFEHNCWWSNRTLFRASEHFKKIHSSLSEVSNNECLGSKNYTPSNINNHENVETSNNDILPDSIDNTSPLSTTDECEYTKKRKIYENINKSFISEQSKKYFCHEVNETGSGIKHIIGDAFSQKSFSTKKATKEEVSYHLQVAYLLKDMTTEKKKVLASVFSKTSTAQSFLKVTRVPTSIQDFNHFYTSKNTSIVKSSPNPKVKSKNFHAVVSITDLIVYYFAKGYKLYDAQNTPF